MLYYSTLIALSVVLASTYGADLGAPRIPAAPEGPVRQVVYPAGPPPQPQQYSPELQYNLLEPQFQYPGFNYYPDKQPYPRVQPPFVFYAGAAPPGQQFLYRPGSPPGNFLVPQPQPQPQPQPGVYYGGQGPVFVAGYPRPAHIPPIEKDAEEIPGLAGNHPVTGRPMIRHPTVRKPEKLETLDEPISPSAGEADVLAEADKNPVFPKKSTPSIPTFPGLPALKPGQRFFILNGHPLYSHIPLEGSGAPQPNLPPTLHQSNPEIYLYRQPQYVSEYQPHQFDQVPIQDLFLRNSVTGQISDVKPNGFIQPSHFTDGNFISLNQPNDFRENYFLKNVVPVPVAPQEPQQRLVQKEYNLAPVLVKTAKPETAKVVQARVGKGIELPQQTPILQADPFGPIYVANPYSDVPTYGNYYQYADLKNGKEEDDSVVIDAKVQNDKSESEEVTTTSKPPEEPSLSQAQPLAIALAGTGGVASAGPRGTALAGVKGLAVARPQATAIAGPSKEESETKTKPKKGRQ